MKTILKCGIAAAIALSASLPAAAEGFGLGVRGSTLGITYEASLALTDYIALRAGKNGYSGDYDTTQDEINYNLDADLDSRHLLLDIHPFAGGFRITGGMVEQNSVFTGTGTSATTYTIGNTTYTPADIGSVAVTMNWDDRYTYAGLGWATKPRGTGFGFSFDVGMVLQDAPNVNVTVQSPLLTDPLLGPQLQSNIELEEQQLREDASEYENYPVVSLGLSYHF